MYIEIYGPENLVPLVQKRKLVVSNLARDGTYSMCFVKKKKKK